jgi:sugar lactone lactonase YvrE
MLFEHLLSDLKFILFPDREADQALPVMDGPWTPNRRLDQAWPLGPDIDGCDDIAQAQDGRLFISAGRQILELSGADLAQRRVHAEFQQEVGPLLAAGGALYAGLAGAGVVRLDAQGRETARLQAADGRPLHCATAIAALPDGRLAITEGSSQNPPQRWCHDLMERRALGRLLAADADLSQAATVLDHLAWPAGLLVQADRGQLWFSESWRHRLLALPLAAGAAPQPLVRNMPGYPGRLAPDRSGGAWLALFAVRTQLVELVLRERKFRQEMLADIDPHFWIAPSLHATGHYLEPLQGGALKKLGMMKPWAPPRSYGLIVHLAADGESTGSLHSRAGGLHHGITAVCVRDGRLLAVSKGGSRLLDTGAEAAA